MQDIIPPKKRSIRDIPLPENKSRVIRDFETNTEDNYITQESIKEANEVPQVSKQEVKEVRKNFNYETEQDNLTFSPKKKSYIPKILFSILGLALVFTFYLVSRDSAKVYVYAKELTQTSNVSVNLSYNPLELTSEKSVSVKATGEEQVTEKAKGKITIYNEFEEKEQRLLKNTRFEAPGELIYRIPNSVVVPAMTKDATGKSIPGKLEVEVVADVAGEKYNIGPTKFTVPGFKGLPQYNSFYAVSEKSLYGGFDGIRKVISDSDRKEAENSLKTQVKDELIRLAREKTSSDNVVLANDSMITYEILGDKVDGGNVSVSARGTIKAASFNLKEFSNSIARSLIQISDSEQLIIKNIADLNVSISNIEDNRATVDISGSIHFFWQNDLDALKESIKGVNKNELDKVINNFPGIVRISAEVMPFWSKKIPSDVSKIKVIDSKN